MLQTALKNIATRLRIESIRSTSEAGSGHPTTCCSAADIIAALFFAEMRYDPTQPSIRAPIVSSCRKGHAAPILYAVWAEAGYIPRAQLLTLREFTSDLEGHPTPRLPFVDVATGSLGQGLGAGVGIALNARRIGSDYRTYVMMGDGETAEGSVWEVGGDGRELPARFALRDRRRQRPRPEPRDAVRARHGGAPAPLGRLRLARHRHRRPPDRRGARRASRKRGARRGSRRSSSRAPRRARASRSSRASRTGTARRSRRATRWIAPFASSKRSSCPSAEGSASKFRRRPAARAGNRPATRRRRPTRSATPIATREAFGAALARLGAVDSRVVALDADVKNSTFTDKFEAEHPERLYQCFIAEQAMLGAAMGLAARGAIPFPATFAAFLTRAADFIRMLAISSLNVKMVGSHSGVSIGEDGPSQMALEDLSMMTAQPDITVLYPSDARQRRAPGRGRRASPRPRLHPHEPPEDAGHLRQRRTFPIGGCKVVRQSRDDRATIVGAGVTLFEALKAHDELKKQGIDVRVIDLYSVQPIDAATLQTAGRETGLLVTVEDHYAVGRHRRRGRARRGAGRRIASAGSPCARFRGAASRRSCSTSTASPPAHRRRRSPARSRAAEPTQATGENADGTASGNVRKVCSPSPRSLRRLLQVASRARRGRPVACRIRPGRRTASTSPSRISIASG